MIGTEEREKETGQNQILQQPQEEPPPDIHGDKLYSCVKQNPGKVADGFEKQPDRLFEADTVDAAADVEVLEKNSLSGGPGFGRSAS